MGTVARVAVARRGDARGDVRRVCVCVCVCVTNVRYIEVCVFIIDR